MITPTRSLYLSAVRSELKSYCDELAHNLTRRGFLVKCRDDFHDRSNQLDAIEEYIRQCDVVICLVGNQYGDEPSKEEAAEFADISKMRHSYAQWEFLFGAHVGKAVYAFCPTDDTPRDNRNHESEEFSRLQAGFREAWIDSGIHGAPIEFIDVVSLRVEALVLRELTPEVVDPHIERTLELSNPYLGYRKFTEKEADKFFGRKKLIDEIIKEVGPNFLVTVFGSLGSGKSSVIRAGVIPQFRKQFPDGKVVTFTPDQNPFASFANALDRAGYSEEVVEAAREPSFDVFSKIRKMADPSKEPWLIFIDQFEEIFTRPAKQDAPVIFQFVNSIIEMAHAKQTLPIRVVLAIRDDFMGRLSEFKGLTEVTDQNLIRVTRPEWADLCAIIEYPAAKHGVRYERDLVSRMVSHFEGESQNLPALEYALYRVWEEEKADLSQFTEGAQIDEEMKQRGGLSDRKINRSSYKAVNGVPHALSTRVKQLFETQTRSEREQMRKMLLSFIVIAETDAGLTPVSKPVPRDELEAAGGPGIGKVIELLLSEGLLEESEAWPDRIELAHDALLLNWKNLSKWAHDSRDAVEMRAELQADARTWEFKMSRQQASFEDLWGGAKLERARELDKLAPDTGLSDFDRVGGLGDLERDFLTASGDRFAREIRKHLSDSADEWKASRRSKEKLWTGAELHRALELNSPQPGEDQSAFDRIGGLEKAAQKFLAASMKNSVPKPILLKIGFILALVVALLGWFTPLGGILMKLMTGGSLKHPLGTSIRS